MATYLVLKGFVRAQFMQTFSTGQNHSLFITTQNHSVIGCGCNADFVLGSHIGSTLPVPVVLPFPEGMASVSAGISSSLCLDFDGNVWAIGTSHFGEIGTPGSVITQAQMLENLPAIKSVNAGPDHSTVLLDYQGYVWVSGRNDSGQLGLNHVKNQVSPCRLEHTPKIKSISSGISHTLLLTEDGQVWGFGYNTKGQLGSRPQFSPTIPAPITLPITMAQVSAGPEHSLFLDNSGHVWSCGSNYNEELGTTETINYTRKPEKIFRNGLPEVVTISAGFRKSTFIDLDGNVWACGRGAGNFATAIPRQFPGLSDIVHVSASAPHSLFLDENASIWVTGENTQGQLGIGETPKSVSGAVLNTNLPPIAFPQLGVTTKSSRSC